MFRDPLTLLPLEVGDYLYRFQTHQRMVHVYRCEVFYVKSRIVCAVPAAAGQGLKPTRLRQFNQVDHRDFQMVTTEEHLRTDLRRFCKLSGVQEVLPTVDQPEHPLHALLRKKALTMICICPKCGRQSGAVLPASGIVVCQFCPWTQMVSTYEVPTLHPRSSVARSLQPVLRGDEEAGGPWADHLG